MYREWGKMCILESRCREVKVREDISGDAAVTRSPLGWEIHQEQPETRGSGCVPHPLFYLTRHSPWAVPSSWFGAIVGVGCHVKNLREDRWKLKDRKTGNKEQGFCRSGSHLVFWNTSSAGIWVKIIFTLVLSRNNLFILAAPEVSLDKLLKITVNGRQVVNTDFSATEV